MSTPIETLCRGLPLEFATYLVYCRRLRFDEAPNYDYCRCLFRELFAREGFMHDGVFDWMMRSYLSSANSRPTSPMSQGRSLSPDSRAGQQMSRKLSRASLQDARRKSGMQGCSLPRTFSRSMLTPVPPPLPGPAPRWGSA
eukprot:gnl/TRDRNA2_/TRDRNA2_90650_c1_seq1.p2 gnl/TRDRNA2_/TRDRNA2_90650_c1~~gnl/TRDRNA2_/TRDRNA2_90650_c1_seq1.p2  ORF type:complete len:141 (-),score=14.15 gnl/TRDRNA2_/TRDRNA2_90650_c1_seq1:39-461(-)